MNQAKIKELIGKAIALDRQITEQTEQLKELKHLLIVEASGREDELASTEGGGSSWVAEDFEGNIARVNFPAAALKSKIDGVGKTIEQIRNIAGKFFPDLFDQAPAYKPCTDFKALALRLMGGVAARKLIKLCSTASAPRVSFETKKEA